MRELRAAAVILVAISLALGLAYPLAMTGVGQVVFGGAADGSLVKRDGKVVGSKLIGQDFSRDTGRKDDEDEPILEPDLTYFQSRPSATGYSASATFFNNLGPNQQDLADALKANVKTYLDRERPTTPGLRAGGIPSDAVTTSASGVDPAISEANARIQANRVAQRRGLKRARVLALVDDHTSHPLLGLGGEGSVNVLELNLALDRESTR
jgi:K+-transporting ATPase ATPase C chain